MFIISWNFLLITKIIVRDKKEIDTRKFFINRNLIPVLLEIKIATRKDETDTSSNRILKAILFAHDPFIYLSRCKLLNIACLSLILSVSV